MVDDLDRRADRSESNRALVVATGWVLLIFVALVGGWIAVQSELIEFGWSEPSDRDVIHAAREFVESGDLSQIARAGRWQTEWESVITTPPPSDPVYRVRELGRRRWQVRGIAIVHDAIGQRRVRWIVILSREGKDWFCERAEVGADEE